MDPSDRQTPEGNGIERLRANRSQIGQAFAIVGLLWQSLFIYGLTQFVVLLLGTFQEITASGVSDPRVMAEGIGKALVPVIVWGAYGVFGLLTTLITIFVSRYRARWWFWSSWAFAIIYLLFVPIGTVLGIALIAALIIKRKEFRGSSRAGVLAGNQVPVATTGLAGDAET